MRDHLRNDLSIEQLAAKANLCPRHFSRRFKTEFATTPAQFVEAMRLNESRNRLSSTHESVEGVGVSVGFNSARAFRRAFERRFGITPARYRECFAAHSNGSNGSKGG
jgi:transcriptional regulator GlxA family with amidase domain